MKIIIGWTVYKLAWEIHGSKGYLMVSNQDYLETKINNLVDKGYKIKDIEFIYTREN